MQYLSFNGMQRGKLTFSSIVWMILISFWKVFQFKKLLKLRDHCTFITRNISFPLHNVLDWYFHFFHLDLIFEDYCSLTLHTVVWQRMIQPSLWTYICWFMSHVSSLILAMHLSCANPFSIFLWINCSVLLSCAERYQLSRAWLVHVSSS